MSPIRLAIAGVGNCASALVQGICRYRGGAQSPDDPPPGLMHWQIGDWRPGDIEVVAAFDVDARKVGRPLPEALLAPPNNALQFHEVTCIDTPTVLMGPPLDGVSTHLADHPEHRRIVLADAEPVDVADALSRSGVQVLINYMPVGSEQAARHYAEAALRAGVALVNCMPAFVISQGDLGQRFAKAGVPAVGDDVKSQLGATILHRALARLFEQRGVRIDSTYQLNTGGNADFLNMLNRDRLTSKRVSKTEAVQSQLDLPLDAEQIHIGPSDYVAFQKDNKVCFLRIEGRGFGGTPIELELRLSVEDSPNSGGVTIDAIRCCALAMARGVGGPLESVCAWTMKHPPAQMSDAEAADAMDAFIRGDRER
jgi:myo-inositol-1-phosphate synthase